MLKWSFEHFAFKFSHEYSMEINLSSQKVWDFMTNPNNFPKWDDRLESCQLEGELREGAVIRAKVKNRSMTFSILITEIYPIKKYTYQVKVPLFTQISTCVFRAITYEKTILTINTSIMSLLAPLMGRFFIKRAKSAYEKILKLLLEDTEQNTLS